MIPAATVGFATALSLILAIGAQNAFVLRQGLLRAHVFALCLFCATSDAILIGLGVGGFDAITTAWPAFPVLMGLAGAAFLFVYGALRLRAAWRGDYALILSGQSPGLWQTLSIAAVLTWANPHVYLDTLGLIGAVSTRYGTREAKLAFGAGAVAASFTFFFSLGYGARFMAPALQSAASWRVLDCLIAAVMWALAAGLLVDAFT